MASRCEAWGNPLCWSVSLFKADLLHWNERSGEAHNVQRVCVYLSLFVLLKGYRPCRRPLSWRVGVLAAQWHFVLGICQLCCCTTQTAKEKVVADLHIGSHGDPLTAYVAVTRVTGREKLAVLRPFDPKPYQQGTRLGRGLLLKVWRGEEIDWEVLRAKFLEEKNLAPNAGSGNGKTNIRRANGNATKAKEYVKNALLAMRRMGSHGNARCVPVGEGPRISRRSTKRRNARSTGSVWRVKNRKNVISVTDCSRKKSSAKGNGCGRNGGSAFAQLARNADSGPAQFARPGVCRHTFHCGQKTTRDNTVDSNVTFAYTWCMPENERMPGCNADAARSPRKRLRRFCKRCVRQFSKQKRRSASAPRSVHREQEEHAREKNAKKNASAETSTCSY